MNIKELFSSKRMKYGAVSTAITLIFLALIVIVNVVASVLTDKFPLTIDLTPNSAFKLSADSVEFVKNLNKPVEITVLANEKNMESGGDIYTAQVKSVIDQYAQYNSGITVSYVDIVSDPTFAAKHEDLNLSYNDILLSSGTKQRKLSMYDMFNVTTNQYTGQQSIKSSKAEQMMTSALMGVTSDSVTKAAFLTGHEEMNVAALQTLLEQNNFEVSTINLTTEEIDPSIDVCFWVSPYRDPDAEILKKLDKWLENDQNYGKSLIYAANAEQPSTPNLDAFLADWGIAVNSGAVLETSSQNIFNYIPYFCTVEYTSEDYRGDIASNIRVSMPYGRPLSALFETQSGYATTTLLSYSDTAVVQPLDADENWTPSKADMGAVSALIRANYTRYEGTTPLVSNVFVASAASSFDQTLLNSKSVTNADYYMNLLNTITNREDTITIAPKELGGTQLGINQFQSVLISAILVILVPLCIIITGLVVWMRRRHK